AIDATTTFRIGCRSLLGLVVNVRVCVSLPAGSGGESIDNRMLVSGGEELQYQLYSDSARTTVWGDSTRAVAVDYVGLLGTQVIHPLTAYGRILAGQSGKPVGTY